MAINSLPVVAVDPPITSRLSYLARDDAQARRQFVERRHPEWVRNRLRWQFFLDSLEGGQRYREAIYGYDTRGLPVRNLIRHKHEYPLKNESPDPWTVPYASNYGNTLQTSPWDLPGQDQAAKATLDDYELRRARTPVPSFVREALETHLSKVFSKEVIRDGPTELLAWWEDVDGKGTSIERWIEEEVAPQFMLIGFIDILFDHPPVPEGEEVRTEADVARLGLRSCRARTILPENMLWWKLDWRGRYVECLVGEYLEDESGVPRPCFRHWTSEGSRLYDADGDPIGPAVPHRFGRVPIERFFDRRKTRESNVGQSRYESICDKMREYYNRDSELVLSDTQQVHAIVQGPEDVLDADGDMPVGPGWMLPMKKIDRGGTVTYEPWSILGYPTAGAASLRENKQDLRDGIDRDSRMVKPAGTAGTGANPVSQSGISKRMDSQDGNALLGQVAGSLQRLEEGCATLGLLVMREGREATPAELGSIRIVYPKRFDLMGLNDLAAAGPAFQAFLAQAGESPEAEIAIACLFIRELLPGLEDERYAAIDAEIRAVIEAKAEDLNRRREALAVIPPSTDVDMLDEFDEPTSDVVESSPEVDPLTLEIVQPLPQVSGGPLS